MTDKKGTPEYKADFLWPCEKEIDALLYEFCNASTEDYRKQMFIEIKRIINNYDALVAENAELKRNWLSEPHEPMGEGFWGRAAARLQMDNVKLVDAVGKLREALKLLEVSTVLTAYNLHAFEKARNVLSSTEGLERSQK